MNRVKQLLVIDETHQKHADDSAGDPVELLDMSPGELGVLGGAADLQHPEAAKQHDKDEEQPVEIAE